MIIIGKYIFFNSAEGFRQKDLNYFVDMVSVMLGATIDNYPRLKLLKNSRISRAGHILNADFSDVIEFSLSHYNMKANSFFRNKEDIERYVNNEYLNDNGSFDIDDWNYVMPISDIVHEIIHVFQIYYSSKAYPATNDNYLEAIAEIYTMILTADIEIDYEKETVALWYVLRKILKYDHVEFYHYIRSNITGEQNFSSLLSDKDFVSLLSKKFNNSFDVFKKDFVSKYFDQSLVSEALHDIQSVNRYFYHPI